MCTHARVNCNFYTMLQQQATVLTGNAIFPLPCHTLLSAASGISFEELKHGLQSLKQSLTGEALH